MPRRRGGYSEASANPLIAGPLTTWTSRGSYASRGRVSPAAGGLPAVEYAGFASQAEARRAFLDLWREVERLGSAEEVERVSERWLNRWR